MIGAAAAGRRTNSRPRRSWRCALPMALPMLSAAPAMPLVDFCPALSHASGTLLRKGIRVAAIRIRERINSEDGRKQLQTS